MRGTWRAALGARRSRRRLPLGGWRFGFALTGFASDRNGLAVARPQLLCLVRSALRGMRPRVWDPMRHCCAHGGEQGGRERRRRFSSLQHARGMRRFRCRPHRRCASSGQIPLKSVVEEHSELLPLLCAHTLFHLVCEQRSRLGACGCTSSGKRLCAYQRRTKYSCTIPIRAKFPSVACLHAGVCPHRFVPTMSSARITRVQMSLLWLWGVSLMDTVRIAGLPAETLEECAQNPMSRQPARCRRQASVKERSNTTPAQITSDHILHTSPLSTSDLAAGTEQSRTCVLRYAMENAAEAVIRLRLAAGNPQKDWW